MLPHAPTHESPLPPLLRRGLRWFWRFSRGSISQHFPQQSAPILGTSESSVGREARSSSWERGGVERRLSPLNLLIQPTHPLGKYNTLYSTWVCSVRQTHHHLATLYLTSGSPAWVHFPTAVHCMHVIPSRRDSK